MWICGVALHAGYSKTAGQATAPADLDLLTKTPRAGWLTDEAVIELLAAVSQPPKHLSRAVDSRAFLVARDEQADRPVECTRPCAQKPRNSRDEARDRDIHVYPCVAVQRVASD